MSYHVTNARDVMIVTYKCT